MSALQPSPRVMDSAGFIQCAASIMGWGDLEDQLVMDIGCGVGNSSKAFATIFPKVKRVIAVDVLPERVKAAKKRNPHPKIDYERGDIQNKFTMARWTGDIDKVVSIFCFNCVLYQREAYINLLSLLKPKGEAAILQSLYSSYYDFLKELAESPKWIAYTDAIGLSIPVSHFEKYTADRYREILKEIGFEVIECREETRTYTYSSDAECKEAVFHSCPLNAVIPAELKDEFKEEAYELFAKHNKRNENGQLCLTYCILTLLLRRPEILVDKGSDDETN